MFAQHAIACVLCELLLELFLVFFQTLKRFLTSFSILFNFQGPVRLSLAAGSLFILSQKRFFVKLFFSRLLNVLNLDASKFLGTDRNVSASIGSFQRLCAEASEVILCLSAWRSHIVPHSRGFGKPFFKVFCAFFAFVYRSQFFAPNFRFFRAGLPSFFLFI